MLKMADFNKGQKKFEKTNQSLLDTFKTEISIPWADIKDSAVSRVGLLLVLSD